MSKKSVALLLTVFLAFLLPMAASACNRCGRITKIHSYEAANNGTAGAVIGAVAGGVIGNQIGGGSGKTLATIAGTAGGAYAGKKVADNTTRTRFKISVKMDDGHYEHCDQGSAKNLHIGDRVQVKGGKAHRL